VRRDLALDPDLIRDARPGPASPPSSSGGRPNPQ
jgi:hypothetical protein